MSVIISNYSDNLVSYFLSEKNRLVTLLPSTVRIEHVGSTAVGIGGKNIIDILIGVKNASEMAQIRDILTKNGYLEGHDSHPDRIFLASKQGETGEGDFHIHICPVSKNTFKDFIILRDYLKNNPLKAQEYLAKKHEFAKTANFDRKKYKALKSSYISNLITEAKK